MRYAAGRLPRLALNDTCMPTSSEIDLLRQKSMAVLEHSEQLVAIGRKRQVFPRRQRGV